MERYDPSVGKELLATKVKNSIPKQVSPLRMKFIWTIFCIVEHYRISQSDFKKAYDYVPFDGPGIINWTVRGPSYR